MTNFYEWNGFKYDSTTGVIYGRKGKPITAKDKTGYIRVSYRVNGKRKNMRAHRVAFYAMGVEVPEGYEIDHINHNRSDNRWSNLRLVTHRENTMNRSKQKNNVSGVNGVYWHKRVKRWIAQIVVDGKKIYLGCFAEFHEAVNARKNAEVLYEYHENHGK
jgi:hypothetical protein